VQLIYLSCLILHIRLFHKSGLHISLLFCVIFCIIMKFDYITNFFNNDFVLVGCMQLESFLPLFTSNWCDSIFHLSHEFHHIIQLHPYCHICWRHQFNNLEMFIGNFYSMYFFHPSSKLHQQVCQYVAISSIWFIFIHVTSSLKLFHSIKLMSSWSDLPLSFTVFFSLPKAHRWGTFSKCGAGFGFYLILRPFIENTLTPKTLPDT